MSVTFAVAVVRLASRKTLIQQMSATESLAAVDTICVDKTGTLTDGELRLLGVEVAEGVEERGGARGPGALRRQRRGAQPDPGDDRRALPGEGGPGRGRGPLLLAVEVERAANRRQELRDGRPGRARAGRCPDPAAGPRRRSPAARDRGRAAGRRLRRVGRGAAPLASGSAAAAAGAARPGRARRDAAPRRLRDDRLHARPGSRPEADLRRRAGDGHGGRRRRRRPRRRRHDRRLRAARGRRRPGRGGARTTRSSAGSPPSRRRRWSAPCANRAATRR